MLVTARTAIAFGCRSVATRNEPTQSGEEVGRLVPERARRAARATRPDRTENPWASPVTSAS